MMRCDKDIKMNQLIQNINNGTASIIRAPSPSLNPNSLLIRTVSSLISTGTERMVINFAKSSYLEKAKQHPDKVKMLLEKIKTDGLIQTYKTARDRLNQPFPLGYCNAGIVEAVGQNIIDFKAGDRVISNGPHADIVKVPSHLCALIPDRVDFESASFTILSSIALQGIRLASPSLGENFVVIGAGLIGLITIQLLKAHGCNVLAIDFDESKLNLAKKFGALTCNLGNNEDPLSVAKIFSQNYGVDGVIITAATQSNEPIKQAAQMSRKRGRIILVGVIGLALNRADFYEKELTFQVSCSYGPGRYDINYEEKNLDYPIGFVRWTEQRNFQAVLDMMASNKLDVKSLISHRFLFENADLAYQILYKDKASLGIILQYETPKEEYRVKEITLSQEPHFKANEPIIGFIGAGNYAARILIPAFKSINAQLDTIASENGLSAAVQGQKLGFKKASTDTNSLISNNKINTAVIVTRHHLHAELVIKTLEAKKNVFVEKPLALTLDELSKIESAYKKANSDGTQIHLMVGFNRRFSPLTQKMKSLLLSLNEPKSFIFTINAGEINETHWTQDITVGGGRIIGECCHFIDLMRFLSGSKITSFSAKSLGDDSNLGITDDKCAITLAFEDGSTGTIHYLANGSPDFPKERIEVFSSGRILQLDNFRKLRGYGWKNFKKMTLWRQDKGQNECVKQFIQSIKLGRTTPIPFNEIMEVSRATIEVALSLRQKIAAST